MAIIVVCPGCRKSFKVSDKFAGKTGPCPTCKRTLQVPTKAEEVQVHAPEAFAGGGRSTSGKLVTEPIARVNAKFHPVKAVLIAAAAVVVLVAAWLGRPIWTMQGTQGLLARIIGLLVVSPPLVLAAYAVLRDDELEPYRGTALYVRAAACSLAYAALWGVFAFLFQGWLTGELWQWIVVVPVMAMLGGGAALASLDLQLGDAVFHYGFYLIVTVLLRWAAGMGWVWNL